MKRRAPRLYAGVLTPAGVHVISYRRSRGHLDVIRYRAEERPLVGIAEAAGELASLLEAEGARNGRLSLSITGFGTCQHILNLPAASPELLQPVLQREMRRLYPDLFAAGTDDHYQGSVASGSAPARPDSSLRDMLAAAVPKRVVAELRETLAARGIALDHLTVLPAALMRVYEAMVDGEAGHAAAVGVVLPNFPVVGFFYGGGMRLFAEPTATGQDLGAVTAEQIKRGKLYLRQQFRGASIDAIHLSAEAGDRELLTEWLTAAENPPVRELSPSDPPGVLLGLGTALNAEADDALDLLPPEFRPPSAAEAWTRALAVAACAVLILAASWWALTGVRTEAVAAERLRSARQTLAPALAEFAPTSAILTERREHAVRSEVLRQITVERERIPELLWPLQAAYPAVNVRSFLLGRTAEGWQGLLQGTATASSSASAAATVDALHQELGRELPPGSLRLQNLSYGDGPASEQTLNGVAVSFRMSFIVPLEEWTVE